MIDASRIEQLRTDAWNDYLDTVRGAREESEDRYREIEPYAWELLQSNLAKLQQLEDALGKSGGGQTGHLASR
jgi:hypothetical protein